MLDAYLQASIGQLLERARGLHMAIAGPKAREFHALWQLCRDQLNRVIDGLENLMDDPRYRAQGAQGIRLRDYKRRVRDLDLLENIGCAALVRANAGDERMTRLVGNIAVEIRYPLIPPAVAGQSQSYFEAYPFFNLLLVPQKEGNFLLHLPDLHHELGHFVLTEENHQQAALFQKAHEKSIAAALTYLHGLSVGGPARGPQEDQQIIPIWEACWIKAWTTELFCDVFGVCSAGPAYGWAHLHLCTKRGGDPFHMDRSARSSHPPDDARMKVILDALTLLGHARAAADIEAKWKGLLAIAGYRKSPEYSRCFPGALLREMAAGAADGYAKMGCVPPQQQAGVAKSYQTLNEAWERFWVNPAEYPEWEKRRWQT